MFIVEQDSIVTAVLTIVGCYGNNTGICFDWKRELFVDRETDIWGKK